LIVFIFASLWFFCLSHLTKSLWHESCCRHKNEAPQFRNM